MEDNNNNNATNINFGLLSKIYVSDGRNNFNKDKVNEQHTILITKDNYLALKKKYKFVIFENQYDKEEDENIIFKIQIKPDEIKLMNVLNRCENYCDNEHFYESINNINFTLWKLLEKCDDKNNINEKNKERYIYDLKENDIIRLGNVKLILREFNISNNSNKETENKNEINLNYIYNKKRQFTIQLKNNEEEICSICHKKYTERDNPIIKICNCEEYNHFKCLKEEIKKETNEKKYNNDESTRYFIINHCSKCKKFKHLNFIIEMKNEIDKRKKFKLFELVDIPRNKNEDYLLFEMIDFLTSHPYNVYKKYFYLIKLKKPDNNANNNIETIAIGNRSNNKYDKYIKLIDSSTVSEEHALIEYNSEKKSLTLINLSKKHDTLILSNTTSLKPNDEPVFFELGNIKIEASLIKYDEAEFEEMKAKMEDDPSIEFRDPEK